MLQFATLCGGKTMNDQAFVTLTELAATFGVSRAAISAWLVEIGLRTGSGTPTQNALKEGFCEVRAGGALILWHRQRAIAALKAAGHSTANEQQAKDGLTTMIATARSVMGWGGIQEVVIAMKAKEQGIEVREL